MNTYGNMDSETNNDLINHYPANVENRVSS
jgi:hypothetical protein